MVTCANRPRRLRRASRKRLWSRARSCWQVSIQPCTWAALGAEPCGAWGSSTSLAVRDGKVSSGILGATRDLSGGETHPAPHSPELMPLALWGPAEGMCEGATAVWGHHLWNQWGRAGDRVLFPGKRKPEPLGKMEARVQSEGLLPVPGRDSGFCTQDRPSQGLERVSGLFGSGPGLV